MRTLNAPIKRSLARDQAGFAATEFALVFPVALLLFLGLVEIGDAVAISRKVTITSRTVTDLVTQNVSVTAASVTNILNASSAILAPYSTANAVITVSEVSTDATGKATVTWSQSLNGTALPVGQVVQLPPTIVQPNIAVIWGQVQYSYAPYLKMNLTGNMTLASQIFLNPRLSNSIPLNP